MGQSSSGRREIQMVCSENDFCDETKRAHEIIRDRNEEMKRLKGALYLADYKLTEIQGKLNVSTP